MKPELVANEIAFHVKQLPSWRDRCANSKCRAPIKAFRGRGYCNKCHAEYVRAQRAIISQWWDAEGHAAFERWKQNR